MIYMFKVDMLVAALAFGLAGIFILALFVWTEVKKCAHAVRAMQRIGSSASRERFAISRMSSRNPNTNSFRTE